MCLNVAGTRRDTASFWTERAYSRLRRVKARVDPGDVIRSNHAIQQPAEQHRDLTLIVTINHTEST
jgi:hypothetical protein